MTYQDNHNTDAVCTCESLPDTELPAQWRRQAALGIMSELWWIIILQLGGLDITVPRGSMQIGPHMRGYADAMLGGAPVEFKMMCVTPETLVRCTNGKDRPAGELVCGDEVLSFVDGQWAIGHVEQNKKREESVYEVELFNGDKLRATGEHRWVTHEGWVRTDELSKESTLRLWVKPRPQIKFGQVNNRVNSFFQQSSIPARVVSWLLRLNVRMPKLSISLEDKFVRRNIRVDDCVASETSLFNEIKAGSGQQTAQGELKRGRSFLFASPFLSAAQHFCNHVLRTLRSIQLHKSFASKGGRPTTINRACALAIFGVLPVGFLPSAQLSLSGLGPDTPVLPIDQCYTRNGEFSRCPESNRDLIAPRVPVWATFVAESVKLSTRLWLFGSSYWHRFHYNTSRLLSGYADVRVRSVRSLGTQTISALSIDRGVYVVGAGYGAHNTGWEYKRVLEGYGLSSVKPAHHAQLQLYNLGAESEWGLYLASPMDPRFLEKTMQQRRKYGYTYSLQWIYVEWIEKDSGFQEYYLQRAAMISKDQESDEPPEREDSGIPFKGDGEPRWPCGFCAFQKSCVDQYGVGRYGNLG